MPKATSYSQDIPGAVSRSARTDETRHPSSGRFIPPPSASIAQHEHAEHLKNKALAFATTEKVAFETLRKATEAHKKAMDARMEAEKELSDHLASETMAPLYMSGVKPGTPRKA